MSNSLVYLAWDAKLVSRNVEAAVRQDDPGTIKRTAQNVERGNEIMRSWLSQNDGELLFAHGDEGWASLPGQKLEELQVVHEQLQDAWNDDVAIGVGLDLSEAQKALKLAMKRGAGNILFYTPEVEQEVSDKKEDHGLDSLLGKAELEKKAPPGFSEETMHKLKREHGVESAFKIAWAAYNKKNGVKKATPEDAFTPASPMGGDAPAATSPDSPVASASEHSQGEQAMAAADAVRSPSTTHAADGLEGQFHSLAMQGEQEANRSQAQAQAAEQNAGGDDVEQIKQQVAQILVKVKKQAPVLEQMKEQAPEAYAAITSMVQAMIAMARELMSIQGQGAAQAQQQEQGQPPAEEQTQKSELTKANPDYDPNFKPNELDDQSDLVETTLNHQGTGIKGMIPRRWVSKQPKVLPDRKQGYQGAAHAAGNHIIKIQWHPNIAKARKHLDRIKRLRGSGLPVVPVLGAGFFANGEAGHHGLGRYDEGNEQEENGVFTYEVLKKLREGPWKKDADYGDDSLFYEEEAPVLNNELAEGGFGHTDLHEDNAMVDTKGNPLAIDLESIHTLKSESDLAKMAAPRMAPFQLEHQGETIRGTIPAKWARLRAKLLEDQGYQAAAHALGPKHVIKAQWHGTKAKANAYVKRLFKLKKLGLSTMVPIVDAGLFGPSHSHEHRNLDDNSGNGKGYFTYEIMKKLHNPEDPGEAADAAQYGLNRQGYGHTDMHGGNVMVDTKGNPLAIDLESIRTLKPSDVKRDWGNGRTSSRFKIIKRKGKEIPIRRTDEFFEDMIDKGEMAVTEPEPTKPFPKGKKLSKEGLPVPEKQVPSNPIRAVHSKLPAGTEGIINLKGNRQEDHAKLSHTGPDGKVSTVRRQMRSGKVLTTENLKEAAQGNTHAVSALNPHDGGGQSAAQEQPEQRPEQH